MSFISNSLCRWANIEREQENKIIKKKGKSLNCGDGYELFSLFKYKDVVTFVQKKKNAKNLSFLLCYIIFTFPIFPGTMFQAHVKHFPSSHSHCRLQAFLLS